MKTSDKIVFEINETDSRIGNLTQAINILEEQKKELLETSRRLTMLLAVVLIEEEKK